MCADLLLSWRIPDRDVNACSLQQKAGWIVKDSYMTLMDHKPCYSMHERIAEAYLSCFMHENTPPDSLADFLKILGLSPEEFRLYFKDFEDIEQNVWKDTISVSTILLRSDPEFDHYGLLEKLAGFYFHLIETLTLHKDFFHAFIRKKGNSEKLQNWVGKEIEAFMHESVDACLPDKWSEGNHEFCRVLTGRSRELFLRILMHWSDNNGLVSMTTDEFIEKEVIHLVVAAETARNR